MGKNNTIPLSSSFMLTSILGFFVSVYFVMQLSTTWGFTFALFFVIMFIASIVSISNIDPDDRDAHNVLAIHHRKKRK
jgi:hypothetical protein